MKYEIILAVILAVSFSGVFAYGTIIPAGGPQLDLVIKAQSIVEVAQDYTIFIEAQDVRYQVNPARHTIPYVEFIIQTTDGNQIIHEIEGKTQKNGKASIPIFITTHDYEPWRAYNTTVSANYNNYSDTEQTSFYVIERDGTGDNIKEQEE